MRIRNGRFNTRKPSKLIDKMQLIIKDFYRKTPVDQDLVVFILNKIKKRRSIHLGKKHACIVKQILDRARAEFNELAKLGETHYRGYKLDELNNFIDYVNSLW